MKMGERLILGRWPGGRNLPGPDIYAKLGVRGRAEAAAYAVRAGLAVTAGNGGSPSCADPGRQPMTSA